MAYDWDKIYKDAIKVAKNGGVTTLDEVISLLPCEKSSFFDHFKRDSEYLESIKVELANSKNKTKISIRKKMFDSNNPTAWITLYRMICTPEERESITLTHTDITSNGKDIQVTKTIEELKEELGELEKLNKDE